MLRNEEIPMKKSDARVRYTKRVLKESLLILLKQKPVNKITVREVCELAELNRATFYTHYSDCYALMEEIEQELIEAFRASLKHHNTLDVTELIEAIYDMIEQHEEACRILVFNGDNPSVLIKMIDLARDSSINYWRQHLNHASETELVMLYTHLSNGLMNVVVDGYDKYPREDVVRFVNRIVKGTLSLYR